jgi:HlyD family secretion protein
MHTIIRPVVQVADLLGRSAAHERNSKQLHRLVGLGFATVLILAVVYVSGRSRNPNAALVYETDTVSRGNLRIAVVATGNLQPTNQVEVGSELSGTVETVFVKENDRVKKGQVLARLDTSKLRDQITQSEANLTATQAKLAQSKATVNEAAASLERLREVSRLSNGKVPSHAEMETAEATSARAQADQANSQALIDQARAILSSDQINLRKASILSPINGVVLTRSVEPGQTVAAALQVATLFKIAEDLRQMELKVNVDEADVGSVKDNQAATFTVDAYPGRTYFATVKRVAFGSQTKDNVVSYSTILKVQNEDLSLRPGMTGTAEIITAARDNVLLVPNSALRFMPPRDDTIPEKPGGLLGRLLPTPPTGETPQTKMTTKSDAQTVWIVRDGRPVALAVTTGQSNGKVTEITAGELAEGMRVITDSTSTGK